MGIRLIRDRFIAGHSSCELLGYLDSVPPETPIRDVVDRCRVWEGHTDTQGMASPAPVPAPVPEVPMVENLLQHLMAETQSRQPAPVIPPEPVGLEYLLRSYLSGQQTSGQQSRQRPIRRDWNGIVCFSCGKAGHSCHALDESFPFMLPGWRAETTPGGFMMISPRVAAERHRAENGD